MESKRASDEAKDEEKPNLWKKESLESGFWNLESVRSVESVCLTKQFRLFGFDDEEKTGFSLHSVSFINHECRKRARERENDRWDADHVQF